MARFEMASDIGQIVLRNLMAGDEMPELPDEGFIQLWPGVHMFPLYGRNKDGSPESPDKPSAAFLRYDSGASVPQHEHRGFEHIFVLAGSQSDEHANYPAGTFIINPPGTRHTVRSDEGCLVLAVWNRPVEMTNDDANRDD
jgi:anti-sigma factor ChrR (cupin superfamily)